MCGYAQQRRKVPICRVCPGSRYWYRIRICRMGSFKVSGSFGLSTSTGLGRSIIVRHASTGCVTKSSTPEAPAVDECIGSMPWTDIPMSMSVASGLGQTKIVGCKISTCRWSTPQDRRSSEPPTTGTSSPRRMRWNLKFRRCQKVGTDSTGKRFGARTFNLPSLNSDIGGRIHVGTTCRFSRMYSPVRKTPVLRSPKSSNRL